MNSRMKLGAGWTIAVTILAGTLAMLGTSRASHADQIAWETTWDSAQAQSRMSGKPLMVDFYTDWCGWCKKLDAEVYPDPQVVAMSHRFVMLRLDAEHEGAAQAVKYRVHSYPTLMFFAPDGKIIKFWSGYMPAPGFVQQMQSVVGSAAPAGNAAPPSTTGTAKVMQFAPPALSPQARQQMDALRRAQAQKNYSQTYVLEDDGSAVVLDENGSRHVSSKPKPAKAAPFKAKAAKTKPHLTARKPAPRIVQH